jgi:chaperonin cofactor prefoldin
VFVLVFFDVKSFAASRLFELTHFLAFYALPQARTKNTEMSAQAQVARASAMRQAELVEKQKHLMELEQKVTTLKQQANSMAGHLAALEREKKKCQITEAALKPLKPDHKVYKQIGRLFLSRSVTDLVEEHVNKEKMCVSEVARLNEEGQKIGAVIKQEEASLQSQMDEFKRTLLAIEANA